jgi:hypothetical protein
VNNHSPEEYIIVTSGASGIRQSKLLDAFCDAKCIDMQYCVSKNADGEINDEFTITTNYSDCFLRRSYQSLYQDLDEFVVILNKQCVKLIIDISGFHLRLLGALLSMLADYKWESLICAYTESGAYPFSGKGIPFDRHNKEGIRFHPRRFDLHSSFLGYDEIPNLKTTTTKRDDYVWVVFLGFEGHRAAGIYTEIQGDTTNVIPVITMPTIRPGWANYAFEANQGLFDSARLQCSDFDYMDALDPYATYNYLKELQERYPQKHLVISPLGTRPISLGVILYAMMNLDSEIFIDTPGESESKIVSCGETHLYDILSFFTQESD